jgi:hypothetical protein
MSLALTSFPFATPYDPSDDPPTSIDPLGTVSQAERLAEIVLPGVTGRMWRARLLTFSAVSSLVAQTVVDLTGRDEVRDDARFAFERLFVSALVRRENDAGMVLAARRVPGTDRAKRALRTGEPLTRANFLKGQAINGPNGVMARLARHTGIVDDEHRLAPRGWEVLAAWSRDESLPGVLEGRRDAGDGGRWIGQLAQSTRGALDGVWPGNQAGIWEELVAHLRPDMAGRSERKTLVRLLWTDPAGVRGRALDLLKIAEPTWRENKDDGRMTAERAVLRDGVRPLLQDSPTDALLRTVLETIDAFEQSSCLMQGAFDTLRWSLSATGTASAASVLADGRTTRSLDRCRKNSASVAAALAAALSRIASEPSFPQDAIEPLRQTRADVLRGADSVEALVDAVLDRHDRVQREKHKGRWIERGQQLTLMPGFGFDADAPPKYERQYLHPFRVMNAFVLMGDLGVVRGGQDAEA